jgi:putative transposase
MARSRRIQVAGTYHVTNHAVAGMPLFNDDTDCETRLGFIAQSVREGRFVCNALCLMGNHDHLLITVEDGTLGYVMQRLNRAYAGEFNRRHGRRGRVYRAPYFSALVKTEAHLLELCRYIALNPEEVNLGSAESYQWSSYGGLIGLRKSFSFVDPTPLLDAVGAGENPQASIATLVADGRLRSRWS